MPKTKTYGDFEREAAHQMAADLGHERPQSRYTDSA